MKDVLLAKTQWMTNKGSGPVPCGQAYYLGKHKVGLAVYDGCRPANDKNKYKAVCLLPGKRYENLGHFETIKAAQANVEYAVFDWLQKAKS